MTQTLEGESRPTHFRGVTTIVAKLFNMIRPDVAVFGQKDFQQGAVIRKMVNDLDYAIKIIMAPTVREKDGLAMSSRNKYFTPGQRKEAICLYRALSAAKRLIKDKGVVESAVLRREMKKEIRRVCPVAEVDYIAFTDPETLLPVRKVDRGTVCSLAARFYGVRLIDNMRLIK